MIAWYKKDKDVQESLIQLALANKIINNASNQALSEEFSDPQNDAMEIIMNISNSSLPIEHLRSAYPLFSNLYQSLRFTISEYPLSQADLFNINIDTKLLIQVFGSTNTMSKVLNLYKSKSNKINA